MTPERAKEILPIIQAFAEGKTIQTRKSLLTSCDWEDITDMNNFYGAQYYRIKPEELKVVQQAKDLLPFIQALADGKIVQEFSSDKEGNDVWNPIAECQSNAAWHLLNMSQFKDRLRIKPEEGNLLGEQVDKAGQDVTNTPEYQEFVKEKMKDGVLFEGNGYRIVDKDKVLSGEFHCFKCKEKDEEIKRLKTLRGIKYYGDDNKLSHEDILRMWWSRKIVGVWYKVESYGRGSIGNRNYRIAGTLYSKEELLKDWEYAEVPPVE